MCLLTVCPKGTDKYSKLLLDGIRTASITNIDGAGFAFKRNSTKKVYISKGYQKVEDLLEAIAKYKLKPEDELIIHQRIGNKGAKNTDMNHPFVLSNIKEEILQNNRYVNLPVMAHNGTILSHSKTNSEMSDTYWFIEEVMYQKDMINMLKTDTLFFEILLLTKLGTNRLAFLFPNEDTDYIKIGEFEEEEGYFFSNKSYKSSNIRNVGGQNTYWNNRYSHLGGSEDDWDWSDFEDNRQCRQASLPMIQSKAFEDKNTTTTKDKKLKNASPTNDDIILEGGTSFDDSITGIKYTLYMDMWIPNKFYTSGQFSSIRFNPTIFNYMDFTFQAIKNDNDLNIKKDAFYEIIHFDLTMKREGEGLHAFRKKYGNDREKSEIIYIPHYQIKEMFETKYAGTKGFKKYFGYYKLVRDLNASKNILRTVNKVMDPVNFNKDQRTRFKNVDYLCNSSLSLFQILLTKALYPTEYKAKLNSRSMVVVN